MSGAGLDGIAIIGMSGRFPRSADLAELWRNIAGGVDCVTTFADSELEVVPPPAVLKDPRFVKARGVLDDPDLFDAAFFDLSPRQADLMDPQNRLFLEHAHQALEDAGYDPERFAGPIGVFGGVTLSSYFLHNVLSNPELLRAAGGYQLALGSDRDYLTTFVSYKLDLRGPSLDVQTACSTSLVATVLACQSLLAYGCDLALAGGVSVKLPQRAGYLYQPGGLDSATGRCRSFDAAADGSVYGSGVGVVVLKRLDEALADGDTVHAVILGAALNNDGAAKVGFTAPGVDGQAEAIASAQALAGIDPESVGYVECHGSGTALGDPIEVAALTKAFRAGGATQSGFCAIGSIKSNVGHCSAAAGIAGLLKATLALENRRIPPSVHFERPNPAIDFAASPFYVSRELADWPAAPGVPRRAGVSSFGLGGTNAHAVLEEAPEPDAAPRPSRPVQLLLLSAKSETALEAATDNLATALAVRSDRPIDDLADVAHTLQVGRRLFAHRRMVAGGDAASLARALAERDPRLVLTGVAPSGARPVAFLLPGVGDHYLGMGRGLYATEPAFREPLDRCARLLQPELGVDLREIVHAAERPAAAPPAPSGGPDLRRLLGRAPQAEPDPAARRLDRTLYAQPAVFAIEYALAQLWTSWGVRPEALLGYSLGEYTAACLAGVLTLEDALRLVALRARLIDALPPGAMLAVPVAEDQARGLVASDPELGVAAVNAPSMCVLSGPVAAIEALASRLSAQGVPSRRLPTTHAFHGPVMRRIAPELTELVRGFRLSPPSVPLISNVTGTWMRPDEATDPGYWARHLCQTVRFASGLAALCEVPARALLEVGPGFGLSTLALQNAAPGSDTEPRIALPSLPNAHERQPDQPFLLGALGKLWLSGVAVDWKGFYARERRRRVRLPTYPFERVRHWIEPGAEAASAEAAPRETPRATEIGLHVPVWKRSPPVPAQRSESGGVLVLLDKAGLGEALASRLSARGTDVVRVRAGESFAAPDGANDGAYALDPRSADDWQRLLAAVAASGQPPRTIVHLGNVTADDSPAFVDPRPLVAALAAGAAAGTTLLVASSHLHEVTGAESLDPSRAPLLAAVLGSAGPSVRRAVDVETVRLDDAVDALLAEIDAAAQDGEVVAWRGGHRWARTWDPLPASAAAPALRKGGCYLVAGGLSGFGFEISRLLARSGASRLVLAEAGPFPSRDAWPAWLDGTAGSDASSDEIRRRIARARELESLGVEVTVSGTTSPGAPVEVHGLIDALGLAGTAVAPELAVAAAGSRLAALRARTTGAKPDFCLLLLPLAPLVGESAEAGDVAAGLFLEQVAEASRRSGPVRCTVVALDPPVETEDGEVRDAEPLLAAIGSVLALPLAHHARVALSAESPAALYGRERHSRLEPVDLANVASPAALHARPRLRNAYVPPASDGERTLVAIFGELLGIEGIGIHDSFFELGGHSLLATQVASRVRDRLGAELPVGALFETPTVAGLAARLSVAESDGGPRLSPIRRRQRGESAEARVAQLSDDEVLELLRRKRERQDEEAAR